MRDKKKAGNANLPALILLAALIMFWQMAAMGINAAYILPSPDADSGAIMGTERTAFHRTSSGNHVGGSDRTFDFRCAWTWTGDSDGCK